MWYSMLTVVRLQTRPGELLKEAGEYRLRKMATAGRPRLQDRLLPSLGDLLISFGLKLKVQCELDSAVPIFQDAQ